LLARFQIAGVICFRAHPLDRGHHVRLLIRGNIAERGSPSEVLRQFFQHAWKLQQRHHRGIPFLILRRLLQPIARHAQVGFNKRVGGFHLVGIC
jgi:hypothetical protein